MKECVTPEDVVSLLNEIFDLDPCCVERLVNHRVPCNDAVAAHPTIQVLGSSPCRVGLLGILNGLFGVGPDGRGPISGVEDGDLGLQAFVLTHGEQ